MSQYAGVVIPSKEDVLTAFVATIVADSAAMDIAIDGMNARAWPKKQEKLPASTSTKPTRFRGRAVLVVTGEEVPAWDPTETTKVVIQLVTETNKPTDADVPGIRHEKFHSRVNIVVCLDGLTMQDSQMVLPFARALGPTVTMYDDADDVYWMSSTWVTVISNQ